MRTFMSSSAPALGAADARKSSAAKRSTGVVSRIRRWSVQSPPFTTSLGIPGSGVMLPNDPPPPANWKAVT